MSVFTASAWAASSVNSAGYEADKAGDGYALTDAGYRWASASSGAPQWLRADLGTAKTAKWYTVSPGMFASNQDPTAWTFEGTNDGTFASWTTLDARSSQTFPDGETRTFTFTNTTAYRYYRLNISAAGSSTISVSELTLGDGDPLSRLWGWGPGGGVSSGDYTLAVEFYPSVDGNITHLSYYEASAQTGSIVLRVRDGSGTALATVTDTMVSGRYGWREAALSTPLAVTSGTHYEVERYANSAFVGMSYGPTSARTYGDLVMVANGAGTVRGKTFTPRYAVGDNLTDSYSGNYAVGVVFARPAGSAVSVDAPALAVVEAVPAPTVAAGAAVNVAAPVMAAVVAMLAPTVSAGTGVRVDAPTLAVATTIPAPSVVMAAYVNVAAPPLAVTASVPAPAVVAGSSVSVAAPAVDLSVAIPAPTVSFLGGGLVVNAPTLSLVIAMPEVGVVGPLPAETIVTAGVPMPDEVGALVPLVPDAELDFAVPITRTSVLAPALSAEYPAHPEQGAEGAPDVVRADVGYLHLWIGGQDVTYWRGGMTVIRSWESQSPFGDTVAAFEFPQRNPWDVDGEGDLSFLRPDAPVVIGIVKDGVTRRVWSGFLDAAGSGLGEGEDYTYEAKGTFWQAQSRIREPHSIVEPVDIGVWIARVMNASEGRHWRTMPLTPIGITTMTRGARDQYDMEYVQELLSEAVTDDLRQWTLSEVLPGVPRLVLKPAPSTVHATVAYGTPGVDVDLRVDQSTRWDRVFLRGIGPKMGGWANIFYPHLELLAAPAYPMAGFANIDLGTTDADTTSGTGVTDWQRRVDEIRGFANPPVSGAMSSAWVAIIDDLQRRVGVTADGSLGPQTWNATFDRGVPDAEALTPRRLPMASKPTANKWLYSAAGVRLGPNPLFDRSLIVRDVAIDVGPGKTKAEGFKLARKWLARYGTAAANGTITFTLDPNETDRTRISHLSNVKVLGYQGTDRVLQVASKSVDLERGDAGPTYVVTCRVDERARDAMAVEDLLEQRRNAQADPSRNPVNRNRASRAVTDQRIPWDSESPCGVLRRTAVNGASGLWTVVTVPFAEVGKLAGIRLTSTQPFALALFASLRITENKLASIVGNPFVGEKWRDAKDLLDEYGIIEAWGEEGNACGYSPKSEADEGATFTGKFTLDTPVDYWTETPPYVSVAIFMRGGSGWISGEFIPAYEP